MHMMLAPTRESAARAREERQRSEAAPEGEARAAAAES